MDEKEHIKQLIIEAEESIKFFSSAKKPERERATCAAFLRCQGIDFKIDEIESYEDEPPDVIFRDAKFEIKELLDDDRRRHDEYREKLDRLKRANKLSDLTQEYKPKFVTIKDIAEKTTVFLHDYANSYGHKLCASLDALVYFNFMDCYLDDKFEEPDTEELKEQGWRSVSMVSGSTSFVFIAQEDTPEFIARHVGALKQASEVYGLFDLNK